MMTAEESTKIREKRLRRMAEGQGLALQKSRRRDPRATDYGTYQLVDPSRNTLVAGDTDTGYGLDLDEVEAWLTLSELALALIRSMLAGGSRLLGGLMEPTASGNGSKPSGSPSPAQRVPTPA